MNHAILSNGGALINFLLLNVFFVGQSLAQLAPVVSFIFILIMLAWFYAVHGLNIEFLAATKQENQEK